MERELRETINKKLINKENISYSDLYFEIFNKRVSEDESRKRIYGLRDLMELKDEKTEDRILCLSDFHVPFQLPVITFSAYAGITDTLVLNGDIVDCTSISKFPKMYRSDLTEDMIEARQYIIELVEFIKPKRVFVIDGNHDTRLGMYLANKVDYDVATLLPNSVNELICDDGFNSINKKTRSKEYFMPLTEVMADMGVYFTYVKDWKYQIGDTVFCHPQAFSSPIMKTADKAMLWFRNEGYNFRQLIMAHTHRVGLYYVGNTCLIEQGCCCDVKQNNYNDGKLINSQKEGFVYFCQDKDGDTLRQNTKLEVLN